MAKYTFYIVSRSADDHYPVLVANNGKVPLNESVKRARSLERSIVNLMLACAQEALPTTPDATGKHVDVVRITHKDFRRKFPAFAKNAKRKK